MSTLRVYLIVRKHRKPVYKGEITLIKDTNRVHWHSDYFLKRAAKFIF